MRWLSEIFRPKPLPKFVPVIFANGEDDDLPGIEAALTNREVQYGERIYRPDEDIEIVNAELVVQNFAQISVVDPHGGQTHFPPPPYLPPFSGAVIRTAISSRHVTIAHSNFTFRPR